MFIPLRLPLSSLLLTSIVCFRFTKKSVVITAPSKVKGGFDIQLPAMQPLISKTSSQYFFLRILKVIIQLREVLVIRRKLETGKGKNFLVAFNNFVVK